MGVQERQLVNHNPKCASLSNGNISTFYDRHPSITIITRTVIIGPLYIRRTIWISTLAARIKFSIFHLVAVYRGIPRSTREKEENKRIASYLANLPYSE